MRFHSRANHEHTATAAASAATAVIDGPSRPRWRRYALLAAAALALLAAPAAASAAGTLDQSQTQVDSAYSVSGSHWIAQTFTAGIGGGLDQVDLDLSVIDFCPPDGSLTVAIESVAAGVPSGVVLASATVAEASVPTTLSFVSVSFAAPAAVSAGTQYAIVASAPSAGATCPPPNPSHPQEYQWAISKQNPYAGGAALVSIDSGASWTAETSGSVDAAFKTYVTPPADTTAPTTAIALDPASPDGHNGWYTSSVGVTVSASDPDDSVAQTRCVLDPASVPASYDDLPSGSCSLTSVSTDGQHTIYAASVDSNGNKETPVSQSFEIDQTAPSLAPTTSPTTIYLNQSGVTASPNATDATSGVASSSCGAIDTSSAGDHTVTCTASDNAGNSNSATIHYTVQYKLLGFFSPASGSKWKAGQTVPIKIALADASGTRISDAQAAALASACKVTFSASGAQTKTAQCMKYDATNHQFVYSWMLAKNGTGAETITVTVSYAGTTTTTTKSESITIT
jgi:hypothetical protein